MQNLHGLQMNMQHFDFSWTTFECIIILIASLKKKFKNFIDYADFGKMMLTQNLKITDDVRNECDTQIFVQ